MPASSAVPLQDDRRGISSANYRVETLVTTDTYVTSVRAVPSSRAVAAVHRDRGDRGDAAVGDQRPARRRQRPAGHAERAAARSAAADRARRRRDVREIHQDTPFSMVALTADDLTGTSAQVRAKKPDGSWGPWYEAETLDGVGPDVPRLRAAPSRCSSAAPPRCRSRSPARPGAAPHRAAPKRARQAGPGLYARHRRAAVRAEHQRGADQPAAGAGRHVAAAVRGHAARASRPPSSAAHSGAPTSRCDAGTRVYDNGIRAAVVHHTAGSNDYAPQDSAGIVRSIYEYHTRTLGWCDIAYNALVDKYGQVFEGRAGGMDKPVEGSHTGGFNREHLGRGDDRRLRRGAADADPVAHHRHGCWAGGWAWTASIRRGTVVLPSAGGSFTKFPRGATADAADDLHPPRRRQHRLPGQRGVRADGPDPRHRGAIQRAARARGAGGVAARRGDLRPMGGDGRDEQPARRAHVAGGVGRGLGALRHLRQGRGVLVAAERGRARHRRDLRGVGRRWASSAARSACRPAARSRSRSGSCRTSSTAR